MGLFMLTLQLTLDNKQSIVRVDGRESHSFSLLDLGQTDKEWKNFFKDPHPYGAKLFQALFKDGSDARTSFDALSKQTERTIVLVLESSDLDGIAWEYAYHDNAYLVEDFAFIRSLPEKERPHSNGRLSKSVERVPLLFIPANPLVDLSGEPMRELDIESEWRGMTQHIVKSNAPFDLIELRPATPATLQSVMARFQNGMIAHFSGHGAVTKDGAFLLFENENGSSNPLEAREFVREVKDQAWIGFLSACQSAVAEKTEYSNLARELVKAGVPFALGMQFNLPDPFAPVISGQFYNWLAQGHAIPEATKQARRAVKRVNEFFVGMIALYAAHPDEVGKMDWRGSGASLVQMFRPADVSDLPSPASGLIGRQRELMRIGTQLIQGKKPLTVTMHGAGGIGKTALLWQSLLRFGPSFDLILALALDPLPSLESILGRIERFLGLPSPCANETKEREMLVCEKLTSKRTLLGLDNFETLNYALNEKDSDEEKTSKSLHAFFKSLAANGVTLCVTSREVTNLPGETIEDVQGLTVENGGRLFQENVVRQKDEIYIEKTQQVSEMVGGHPLALRLLASAFDDQVGKSLDQYIEDLQSNLPKARDKWTEEDRHESLRASFDFTMRNLVKTEEGKNLQTALARLSIFKSFFAPMVVSSVIANKWPAEAEEVKEQHENAQIISRALWQRGLLERATIPLAEENFYLYHLHPALAFFAKERVSDAETIKENYWKSMSGLTHIVEEQKSKSPLMVQIALRAIPDLLTAAEFKNDEDAADMQFSASKSLRQFGLYADALHLLKISHQIYTSLNHQKGMSVTISAMAQIIAARGDLDKAMQLYQETLPKLDNLGSIGAKSKSALLHSMADIHFARGDFDTAMNLYQQALKIDEDMSDVESQNITLQAMANIYFMHGDLDKAMRLYQQILSIEEGLGDLIGKASVLRWIAVIETKRGNFYRALEICKQTLDIANQLGDADGKASSLHQMGVVYTLRRDLDGAMKLYQQSLEIKENIGDLQGRAMTMGMISKIYWEKRNYKEAIKSLLNGLMQLVELKIEPNTQRAMASDIAGWREELGANRFDGLWKEITGQGVPDWLTQLSQQQQGMTRRAVLRRRDST
jgi:tetratricopeptide (TPR) repeat protein